MVGKFAGWLTYLPALPNWVFTSQNSIGGSSMSVTLQDCVFPVAWFLICMKCPLHSIQTVLYLGLHFKSHLPGCLFFEIYTISYLAGWFVSCHCLLSSFKSVFIYMFSLQLPRLIYVFPGSAYWIQGLLGNVA